MQVDTYLFPFFDSAFILAAVKGGSGDLQVLWGSVKEREKGRSKAERSLDERSVLLRCIS